MFLAPAFAIIVAVVGAVGAVAGATAFKVGREIGTKLSAEDLLPAPFPKPPLPRFLYTKPELMKDLLKRK